MRRVAASVRLREEFEQAMSEATPEHPMRHFVQKAAGLLLQTAIEEQVEEFLGRGHYQRGARLRPGWRNGYESVTVKSEAGPLTLARPKLRGTEEPYAFEVPAGLGRTTKELEALAVRAYVRGLSTRDVEGLYGEVFGGRLSKSAVSRTLASLEDHFQAWRSRDLSQERILYLFLDGQYQALRSGTDEKEGVLTAYGIREDGRPVLLHLATGPRESYDAWLGMLHELVERGLNEPLLVVFDGNPGLKRAVREVFPHARRQRCQVHKMRNILAKLPKLARAQMKRLVQQVFLAPSYETGLKRGKALIARFRGRYLDAMACLEADLAECLAFLQFPAEHHKRIRTTNLIERTFEESRRRTKVVPRFPTEGSCLSLMYATLITASARWRGVRMTAKILRALDQTRATEKNEKVAA
jgi:transposase-like protein